MFLEGDQKLPVDPCPLAWESLDHYNALINDAELLATMRDLMAKVVEKRISIHHVRFPVNVETALNAPITELAVMTLKESANRDELLRRSHETLAKMYEELPGVIIPGSCAPLVDNDKKLQVCVGWQSYEVRHSRSSALYMEVDIECMVSPSCWQLFQSEVPRAQGIQPMIMELREMMELVMNHGKLTKFITN